MNVAILWDVASFIVRIWTNVSEKLITSIFKVGKQQN
jgi:hypothetical protein